MPVTAGAARAPPPPPPFAAAPGPSSASAFHAHPTLHKACSRPSAATLHPPALPCPPPLAWPPQVLAARPAFLFDPLLHKRVQYVPPLPAQLPGGPHIEVAATAAASPAAVRRAGPAAAADAADTAEDAGSNSGL